MFSKSPPIEAAWGARAGSPFGSRQEGRHGRCPFARAGVLRFENGRCSSKARGGTPDLSPATSVVGKRATAVRAVSVFEVGSRRPGGNPPGSDFLAQVAGGAAGCGHIA